MAVPNARRPGRLPSAERYMAKRQLWALLVLVTLSGAGPVSAGGVRYTGPWNLADLQQPPRATWGDVQGLGRWVYFESEPFNGKPTRVYAYYSQPSFYFGRLPAVVLLHGNAGKASPEWAQMWA